VRQIREDPPDVALCMVLGVVLETIGGTGNELYQNCKGGKKK
jgi:hypothetical protein